MALITGGQRTRERERGERATLGEHRAETLVDQKVVGIELTSFVSEHLPFGIELRQLVARQRMFFGPMWSSLVLVTNPFERGEKRSMFIVNLSVRSIGNDIDPTGLSAVAR